MDSDALAPDTTKAPRKVRFAPKGPPRRAQKTVVLKPEKAEEDVNAAQAEELMQRFNEASLKAKHKVEKKGPSQVAFGFGGSSSALKSYGPLKGHRNVDSSMANGGIGAQQVQKEYQEPWDYYTNYPVTLPLRRPYSGNPELLDEEEFREASESLRYNENTINSALELGLMEENLEEKMFFVQLPTTMPMLKQTVKAEGDEVANNSRPSRPRACGLNDLTGGFMGKMLVYKSGAVKLKLGEILYDVSPGMDCAFSQDVVAVNTEENYCSNIGELTKRITITPNEDSLLDSI